MNRLAEVLERPEPTLAVTFAEPESYDTIHNIASLGCVAELRVDKLPNTDPEYVRHQISQLAAMPILLTIRSQSEGGDWEGTEYERLQLTLGLLPHVDGVDIGEANPKLEELLKKVVTAAHDLGKTVISSIHDFNVTPLFGELEAKLAHAKAMKAEYAKFAVTTITFEDYRRAAEFTLTHAGDGLIVVGMDKKGPYDVSQWGKRSRISFPWLGSHMTYASANLQPVAPGQMSYQETHARLLKRYPDYARLFK